LKNCKEKIELKQREMNRDFVLRKMKKVIRIKSAKILFKFTIRLSARPILARRKIPVTQTSTEDLCI
jgi:hypothetical protein